MTTRLSTSFAAFGLALVLTLSMLGAVDHLASEKPQAAALAKSAAGSVARV